MTFNWLHLSSPPVPGTSPESSHRPVYTWCWVMFDSSRPFLSTTTTTTTTPLLLSTQNWKEIQQLILLIFTLHDEIAHGIFRGERPIINVMYLLIYVGNRTLGVHHTSWMSRTSWYFSQNFPKGYSGCWPHVRGCTAAAGASLACICHTGEKTSWCSSSLSRNHFITNRCCSLLAGFECEVMGLWTVDPSQELSLKALKCTTPVPASYLSPAGVSLVSSGLWLARQCSGPVQSAAHFILKGYQSYQNKSS